MSKRSHKALASATVMSLILTSTLTATTNVQAAAEVTRMPGADRFATAQEVAKQVFGKAENVILVNGLGYADAVSATPLAKQLNAPILLTDASSKPSADLVATLTKLEAKNVYIVGGNAVVTDSMKDELAKSYKVERIAGEAKDGRYGTNAAVAKKVLEKTKATSAVLVSAEGYADALSVASVAATKGMPVLFGNKNEVPEVVKDIAKDLKVMAVGGEGVLPETVLSQVKAERIAKGADRFDTNLKVLDHFKEDLKFDNIFVAAGGNDMKLKFADALVASAAAAKTGAPVVLNGLGATSTRIDEANKYIKDHMGNSTKVTIVGGEASISSDIEKTLKGENGSSSGKTEVENIESIGLNQVKVVFDSKVNDDTAEDVRNYEIDGTQLTESKDNTYRDTDAIAVLQDDDRTVILTLANKTSQGKDKMVKVRKGILTDDKSRLIDEKEKKVTFRGTTDPVVTDVSIKGNNKLTIEFSEAIFVKATTKYQAVKTLAEEIEINDQTINSLGYNSDEKLSQIKDCVQTKDGYYFNKVEFYFDSALDSDTNTLKVPDGNDDYLVDAGGFTVKEAKKDFKVEKVTTKPQAKSVKGGTDSKIYVNFDRPMDKKTALELNNYELNDRSISADKIEFKEGDTQVKISGVSNTIQTGSNTVTVKNKVKDAYGNKMEDDERVSFTADKDTVKPKLSYVLSVDDTTVRVIFSKDVTKEVAKNTKNYTLKDSSGSKISIEKIVPVADDIYDLILDNKKLDGSKYTLKVENIIDASGNMMDEDTKTLNGADVVPSVSKAAIVSGNTHKVAVVFDQEMKSSTVNKVDNYKYKNGKNEVKALPSDSKISVSSDNKTVTIEFPSSYTVRGNDAKTTNEVKNIIVTRDVESTNGIRMDADETVTINETPLDVQLAKDPITIKEDNTDEATVVLRFDGSIKSVDKTGFEFIDKKNLKVDENGQPATASLNVKANSTRVNGETIEFKFTGDNAKKVKAIGTDLGIKVTGNNDVIEDYSERGIATRLKDSIEKAYVDTNEVAPRLEYDKVGGNVQWATDVENNTLTVKFNTRLDASLESAYKDDFTFVSDKNSKLDVKGSPKVVGNTIIYTFDQDIVKGEKITVKADASPDIRTPKDDNGSGDYIKYAPESADKNEGIKVIVGEVNSKPQVEEVKAESVKLDKETLGLKIGGTYTLAATITPNNSTDKASFTSDKPEIAKVDANTGKVEAIAEGTAVITVKAGDKTATCTVTVTKDGEVTMPKATVNDVVASPDPSKKIVIVELEAGADATKYDVKVDGTSLAYNAEKKLFAGAVKGIVDKADAQAKVQVVLK